MRSYEETRASFRWPAATHFNFATDVVDKWAADPDLVAMRWIGDAADRTLTFRHFAERSDRLPNPPGPLWPAGGGPAPALGARGRGGGGGAARLGSGRRG